MSAVQRCQVEGYQAISNEQTNVERSHYDELHDRFYSILSAKSGTRYERLAAIVFKVLDETRTVVHDLKLRGAADVPHQIDVTIERNGEPRRILIECKDFDLSDGQKVGLPILVHLFGVMTDIGANEGYAVTCNGFTRPALKFAKAKGIKCAVLREFREADWENRIRSIVVNLFAVVPNGPPHMEIGTPDQQSAERLLPYLTEGAVSDASYGAKLVLPLHKFIESQMNALKNPKVGPVKTKIGLGDAALEIGADRIPLSELTLKYEFQSVLARTEEIKGNGVALLLIQGFGDTDLLIWDRDLQAYTISGDGKVVARETSSS